MPIRWTSRKALTEELDQLHGLRLDVYEAIRDWPASQQGPTREQLAAKLHRKESSICGRVNELLHAELVAAGPLVKNPTTGKHAESLIAIAYREEVFQPAPAITPDDCQSDASGQLDFFSAVHKPCKPLSGAFKDV